MTEQGHAVAQYNFGHMYSRGNGVPQDNVEAIKWQGKPGGLGDLDAKYYVDVMYDLGHGVVQDYAKAAKWFRKAAEQGHAQPKWFRLS